MKNCSGRKWNLGLLVDFQESVPPRKVHLSSWYSVKKKKRGNAYKLKYRKSYLNVRKNLFDWKVAVPSH